MNGSSFRPDHRPRHNNRFRRRPSWNRSIGRGSSRMFEDGEIQTQASVPPPPSPPWRRQQRFSRPFKRYRRNDYSHRSRSPASPQRSRPPFLGPVPMLELPTRRRSRFDITPDDERNAAWRKLESNDNQSAKSHADQIRHDISRQYRPDSNHSSIYSGVSPRSDPMSRLNSEFTSLYQSLSNIERRCASDRQDTAPILSATGNGPGPVPEISKPSDGYSSSKLNFPRFQVPEFETLPKYSLEPGDCDTGTSWNERDIAEIKSHISADQRSPLHDHISSCQPLTSPVQSAPNDDIPTMDVNSQAAWVHVTSGSDPVTVLSVPPSSPINESRSSITNADNRDLTSTEPTSLQLDPVSVDRVQSDLTQSFSSLVAIDTLPLELPNQSDLLQQIQKLDDEIAEIELKIVHQRNLIEEKTSSTCTDDVNIINEEIMMVIAESEDSDEILTENRRLAALSAQALAKFHPSWLSERLPDGIFFEPLYQEPGQYSISESIQKNRPQVLRAIRHRKLAERNEECQLALQWWTYYREWRQSISKVDIKSLPPLRHGLTPEQRTYYAGRLAHIQPMLSESSRKAMSWRSRNGLVEDPRAQDQYRKLINPWSDQEKAVFRKKFSKFPKNFVKVASFLPNKSVGDCVAYYYSSKTLVNYKALVKKYRQNLLSRKGIDITAPSHVEGIRSSRIDAPALPTDQNEAKSSAIPRELLKLAEDLSRNNLEVQSGRSRTGKKRRNDSDLSNVSVDNLV